MKDYKPIAPNSYVYNFVGWYNIPHGVAPNKKHWADLTQYERWLIDQIYVRDHPDVLPPRKRYSMKMRMQGYVETHDAALLISTSDQGLRKMVKEGLITAHRIGVKDEQAKSHGAIVFYDPEEIKTLAKKLNRHSWIRSELYGNEFECEHCGIIRAYREELGEYKQCYYSEYGKRRYHSKGMTKCRGRKWTHEEGNNQAIIKFRQP